MKAVLNHIGIAVHDILETCEMLRLIGLKQLTKPEPDPIQKVMACFLATNERQGIHIELIEPTDDTSPIAKFLTNRAGGLHHLCFEVDDIEEMTERLKKNYLTLLKRPISCRFIKLPSSISHR